MVCASFHCRLCIYTAEPLSEVVKHIENYLTFCHQYNLTSAGLLLRHQLQLCLNLMGRSDDQDLMNETDTIAQLQGKHPVALAWLLIMKHMLAVYFHDFVLATRLSGEIHMQLDSMKSAFILPVALDTLLFLEGVTAATLSSCHKDDDNHNKKQQQQQQQERRAQQILSKLQARQRFTCANYENKIRLIQAEIIMAAASRGDDIDMPTAALSLYQQSIEAAHRQGLVQEQALALELAGHFLLKRDDECQPQAREYLEQSRALYAQWGAHAKVRQVDAVLHSIIPLA